MLESGEINAKYRNGGWELWTPGTPPSDEVNLGKRIHLLFE